MELYIIAGPNGVGKTTFASTFLPKYADCKNFINADLIAQGMSPFSPEAAAVRGQAGAQRNQVLCTTARHLRFRDNIVRAKLLEADSGTQEAGIQSPLLLSCGEDGRRSIVTGSRPGVEGRTRRARSGDSSPIQALDQELPCRVSSFG